MVDPGVQKCLKGMRQGLATNLVLMGPQSIIGLASICGVTYPIWCKKSHSHSNLFTLARAKYESFLYSKCFHHLQVHDGGTPVGEIITFCAYFSVHKELDGEQIHLIRKLLVRILASVKLRRCRKGIGQDERRFGRVVSIGHLVASINATEAVHMNGLGV
jgi:hypothetical protein